jgi:hypothetical protein
MEKWGGDLVENLCLKKKDIMMVAGSKQLKGLIHMAKCGTKPPFVSVLSLVTLQGFFDTYEKDPKFCLEEYGAIPQDIWKLLGIGLVGIDEAHEHLYSVFRLTLHLHGPKFVALSGTMLSEDVFVEKIQKTIFPHSVRYDKVKMKKYIKLIPMAYEFQDIRRSRIRTSSFGKGFEEFYQQAKGMGVNFVKGKIGRISEKEGGNLLLRYEDALIAIAEIFSIGAENLSPRDIFTTSCIALLMAAPARGSELFYLKSDCIELTKDEKGKNQLGLRWFSGKGFGYEVEWVPECMWDVVKEAVERLKNLSAGARAFAKSVEEKTYFLPCPTDISLNHKLTREQVSLALGLDVYQFEEYVEVNGDQRHRFHSMI